MSIFSKITPQLQKLSFMALIDWNNANEAFFGAIIIVVSVCCTCVCCLYCGAICAHGIGAPMYRNHPYQLASLQDQEKKIQVKIPTEYV